MSDKKCIFLYGTAYVYKRAILECFVDVYNE